MAFLPNTILEIRYVDDPQPITEKSLPARFWHAFRILMFPRLVGTNVQHLSIPPAFKGTRTQYLLMRLRQFVTSVIIVEVYKSLSGVVKRSPQPLLLPATTVAWIIAIYWALTMAYVGASFIAVATRMSDPEDWPDLFGPYTEAYTVSRAWGRVWHQLLRSICTRWSDIVHRAFGVPRGTLVSRLVLVNVAFAVSGLIHSAGDLAYNGVCFGRSWPFFALNGLAVSLESILAPSARRAGISGKSRAWRLLGYVWVWAWFTYSGPQYRQWTYEIQTAGEEPQRSPVKDAVLLYM
ncbi:membrane bound O-acyl transferase family-domain-containing protein [Trametes elegans]|nr:membrane bound O-acyl transferase family-domain-containing protein [Trametes elegans]